MPLDITDIVKKQADATAELAEQVETLQKSVDGLQLKEGPIGPAGPEGRPGRAANAEAVADMLIAKHADKLRAPEVDVVKLASVIASKHAGAIRGEKGDAGRDGVDGRDGESPSAIEVAAIIVEKHAEALRGKDGLPGKDGADGKDASPEAVAEIIVAKHADILRGEKGADGKDGAPGMDGKDGAPGRDGVDGKSVDPIEVATLVHSKFGEMLKGADGKDGKDGVSVTAADVAVELLTKHADAIRGEAGRDGITSVVTDTDTKQYCKGVAYDEGVIVTHFLGRKYIALCDTIEEPGDSAEWERIGTDGLRFREDHKGVENGDLFIKEYSLWGMFDGQERLLVARPKVDYKQVAKMAADDAGLRDAIKGSLAEFAQSLMSEMVEKAVGLQVGIAVRAEESDGRKYLIVSGVAIDITPVEMDTQKAALAAASEIKSLRAEVAELRSSLQVVLSRGH